MNGRARLLWFAIGLLGLSLVSGCSKTPTKPPGDVTPPASIADLVTTTKTVSSITVNWTAPGDDGAVGTATSYDLRYSTSSITEGNFASASQVPGEPAPTVAGTAQSMVVAGLATNTTYYFALKSSDEVPNISALSSVATGATLAQVADVTPPASIADLVTTTKTVSSITVNWTAPGDDGAVGTATSYDLRYSTSSITEGNFASATQVSGEPAPTVAGTAQSMIVAGLVANTTYYFALKTSDEVPNLSALSNLATGATLASAGDTPPVLVAKWGSSGTGNGQFSSPQGVAVDGSGHVWVADGNHRIQVFSGTGTYVTQWGSPGNGDGQFNTPAGVTVDGSGNVYVVDLGNNRIQKFSGGGTYLTQWGTHGTGNGQFSSPYGVALDGSGNVYVADYGNNRIQVFSSDGTYVTQWGNTGAGSGQFEGPYGVAVDGSGNVYVADVGNRRIQKFSSTGTYLTQWGTYGPGNGQFDAPGNVAVDGSGNVYVADMGNYRIQKFSGTGTYLTQWGTYGTGDGQFGGLNGLGGVAVDGSDNVYVADGNNRIQKFAPTP